MRVRSTLKCEQITTLPRDDLAPGVDDLPGQQVGVDTLARVGAAVVHPVVAAGSTVDDVRTVAGLEARTALVSGDAWKRRGPARIRRAIAS